MVNTTRVVSQKGCSDNIKCGYASVYTWTEIPNFRAKIGSTQRTECENQNKILPDNSHVGRS